MDETLELTLAKKLTLDDSLSDSNKDDNDVQSNETKQQEYKKHEQEVWKWWEEKKKYNGLWESLKHNGPAFPPLYTPFRFLYNGNEFILSSEAEEVAAMYARTLFKDEETKRRFDKNFFNEWKSVMNDADKAKIIEFEKCDFSKMREFFQYILPNKLIKTKEEENHGYCIVDGHRIRLQNFRIQAPDICQISSKLLGVLRKRVKPEDVRINCSETNVPAPPPGHKWKHPIVHDNTAHWLASWKNSLGTTTYMTFHEDSPIQAIKDYEKFEVSRELHKYIKEIRKEYKENWKIPISNKNPMDVQRRQTAIVLYMLDELALRGGNKSDDAENVGVCNLLVKHIKLIHCESDEKNKYKFKLHFPGKGGILYSNEVPVEELVYKNLQDFISNKSETKEVFDKVTPQKINEYLSSKANGSTCKVFRTYHASKTFEEKLYAIPMQASKPEKISLYKKATDDVAKLCNHVRTPKKKNPNKQAEKKQPDTPEEYVPGVATTQKYYNDPRITAAWCDAYGIPIEDVFSKSEREKFIWAIEMVKKEPNFKFASK